VTPEQFAREISARGQGSMLELHGTRFLRAGAGRAVAELDFKPELTQLTGLFHAGAIMALADEAATALAMWEANPSGDFRPELFPLTVQFSINLIRNTNRGTLTAEAELVHRGRTTMVVDVRVLDEGRRLLAKAVATLLAPSGATGKQDRN
jgi:1,4-dihydroxy-2-naphthoyl-CoA hydrolase